MNPQTAGTEQSRLVQANLALRNETMENNIVPSEANHVVTNGSTNDSNSTQLLYKKQNNNGEVRFDLGYSLERETVL